MGARSVVVLVWAVVVGGCDVETGIIVAVSGSSVDELRFHVGVDDGDTFVLDTAGKLSGTGALGRSCNQSGPDNGRCVPVRGRNLRAEPYELMLREPDASGDPLTVRVLALGYKIDAGTPKVVALALTDPPQRFIRQEVVRRAIGLRNLGDAVSVAGSGGSCFRIKLDEHSFGLVTPGDRDCDGSPATGANPDCNDADPAVRPGAAEICDGKDNNCDGEPAAAKLPCYAWVGEQCKLGQRACGDAQGAGYTQECVAGGDLAPALLCQRYSECGHADPLSCVNDIERRQVQCTVQLKDGGGICPGASAPLAAPGGASDCVWEVIDPTDLSIKLRVGDGPLGLRAEACEVSLEIFGEQWERPAVLQLGGSHSQVVEVTIKVEKVATCGATPLTCSG